MPYFQEKSTQLKDWVIKNKKWLAFIALLLLAILIVFRETSVDYPASAENIAILEKVKALTDRNDQLYAELVTLTVSVEQSKHERDSLAYALRLKPKQIKGVDKFTYQTDTIFRDTTIYVGGTVDSTMHQISKIDPWVSIIARAGKDSGSIQYSAWDTLTRIEVVKDPLIGRTKRTTIIRNASPYNQIKSGYSWTTVDKRTWLSIGPSVQWNPINSKISVGVSAQIPLIQLKK